MTLVKNGKETDKKIIQAKDIIFSKIFNNNKMYLAVFVRKQLGFKSGMELIWGKNENGKLILTPSTEIIIEILAKSKVYEDKILIPVKIRKLSGLKNKKELKWHVKNKMLELLDEISFLPDLDFDTKEENTFESEFDKWLEKMDLIQMIKKRGYYRNREEFIRLDKQTLNYYKEKIKEM